MRRIAGSVLAAAALLVEGVSIGGPGRSLFSIQAPREMVTGPVEVRAIVSDSAVRAVRWSVDDWSRVTPPPFTLAFDAGPVPYERRVRAVALDEGRRALYRGEATLNPGGRHLAVEFESPADGQSLSGRVEVELRVRTPSDDEVASVELDSAGTPVPLSPAGPGLLRGVVDVPPREGALVARLATRRGRETERTLLVNAPGLVASVDAHVVDQLVGVSRGEKPVEGLGAADFEVRDEKGRCEVRDVTLLRDAPLSIGFAIDTSVSLRHTPELRKATADVFLDRCFGEKDAAFVLSFGPVVEMQASWTRSKEKLREAVLALEDFGVGGTALYEAVQKAVYELQGGAGARALVLVTDGNDFDGSVSEEAALAYVRQSGVRIFAIGLTSTAAVVEPVRPAAPDGGPPRPAEPRTVIQPANEEVLSRFTAASGGRLWLVHKAEDLPGIYRALERDLRTQYLVSFVSSAPRRATFHPVVVKCRRGHVKTASGFFY